VTRAIARRRHVNPLPHVSPTPVEVSPPPRAKIPKARGLRRALLLGSTALAAVILTVATDAIFGPVAAAHIRHTPQPPQVRIGSGGADGANTGVGGYGGASPGGGAGGNATGAGYTGGSVVGAGGGGGGGFGFTGGRGGTNTSYFEPDGGRGDDVGQPFNFTNTAGSIVHGGVGGLGNTGYGATGGGGGGAGVGGGGGGGGGSYIGGGGGGGGGGGAGVGGGGGAGGYGASGVGGAGGNITGTIRIINHGQIYGGAGAAGDIVFGTPGNGGNGGDAIGYGGGGGLARDGGGPGGLGGVGGGITGPATTIINSGLLQGGDGGAPSLVGLTDGGVGGVGVRGSNLTIVNSGTIAGGFDGNTGTVQSNAILFTGGTNSLELQSGWVIGGNVGNASGVTGTTNTLILGGSSTNLSGNGTATGTIFDVSQIGAKYQNFDLFQKSGASTWQLTSTTAVTTPWTITGGTLQISNDAALGSPNGAFTFGGADPDTGLPGSGALEVTANTTSTRNFTLNNVAGFANTMQVDAGVTYTTNTGVISGAGALTKTGVGTLALDGNNTYTGGTTIIGGVVQISNDAGLGNANGTLTFGGADPNTGLPGSGTLAVTATTSATRNVVLNNIVGFANTIDVSGANDYTIGGVISGQGALTKTDGGALTLTGNDTYTGGTTIGAGTVQLGKGGTSGSIVGNVTDNGTLVFDRSDTLTFGGLISGTGAVNQIGSGVTVLTANSTYSGNTTIAAGTLAAGGVNVFSPNSEYAVQAAGTLDLRGNDQTVASLNNAGLVNMGIGAAPGTVLTTTSYVGQGGAIAMNTFLGGDGSPSDKLVINGGAATGSTALLFTNVGGPGALTTANGIEVVQAINGATTAAGAFRQGSGELRAGAFDYDLFRGGVSGSPNDWFLRSSFLAPPTTPTTPTTPPQPPILPSKPPPNPLPPGVLFPIIGPELATYGVVQPLARQLGVAILGTLDDRVGDTYEPDGCAVAPVVAPAAETPAVDLPTRKPAAVPTKKPGRAPCPLFSPSVWGRFFGQTIDNHYSAFADPRASGNLGGFQGGIDLLRGSLITGQYERAGLYGAYGDVNSDVNGLVTNPAATAYVLTHTGSMNLDAWSAGGYWTHVGPGGWYLDAVLQGTWYYGSASTQFARLNTDGTGFIASLEGGYPFAWPQLGPGFVIEPQGQILWQKVSFRHDYDGLGDVALGDTTGPSGRIGLRTKWTITTAGGQVWQPYLRGNLWRDWGAEANTVFSGTDSVPLLNQATMLEFGGGVTGRINANISVFANVDYEFAVGAAENEKRNGVRGAFGARYTW
jgi:outer membrane autotransporter protein